MTKISEICGLVSRNEHLFEDKTPLYQRAAQYNHAIHQQIVTFLIIVRRVNLATDYISLPKPLIKRILNDIAIDQIIKPIAHQLHHLIDDECDKKNAIKYFLKQCGLSDHEIKELKFSTEIIPSLSLSQSSKIFKKICHIYGIGPTINSLSDPKKTIFKKIINPSFLDQWHDIRTANIPLTTYLSINENILYLLPNIIKRLEKVRTVNLANNELIVLPNELTTLTNLLSLILLNNDLQYLPDNISNLANLQNLYLNSNKIKIFPREITNLLNLRILCLNQNNLTEIPEEIEKLQNLEKLYLNHNKVKKFPDTITGLKKLEKISFDDNLFKTFPETVLNLPQIKSVSCKNNPFSTTIKLCLAFKKVWQQLNRVELYY